MTLCNYSTALNSYDGYGSALSGYNRYGSSYSTRQRTFSTGAQNRMAKDFSGAYDTEISQIASLIRQGEYEEALARREKLIAEMTDSLDAYNYDIDTDSYATLCDAAIKENTGYDIAALINGSGGQSAFENSFWKGAGLGWLCADEMSTDEAEAMYNDVELGVRAKRDKTKGRVVGNVASTAVTVGCAIGAKAAFAAAGSVAATNFWNPVGWVAAGVAVLAGVATIAGLCSWSKED